MGRPRGSTLSVPIQAGIAAALIEGMSFRECASQFDTTRDRVAIIARDYNLIERNLRVRDEAAIRQRISTCERELRYLHELLGAASGSSRSRPTPGGVR